MRKTLLLALLLLGMSAQAGYFNEENSFPLSASNAGRVLDDDCLYYFTGSELTISNPESGGNALVVDDWSTVFLYIAPNQKLILNGGAGEGIRPGGAGIYVPLTSKLYIIGGGMLISNGGAAGYGTKGLFGLPGFFLPSIRQYFGGMGGAGGWGGGGGGAGIGTDGSYGSIGGLPTICLPMSMDSTYGGSGGWNGLPSLPSRSGGEVYMVGPLIVSAHGGTVEGDTIRRASGFPTLRYNTISLTGTDYVAGGGGAGGTANDGMPGMNFGGGGVGAAGAGGGSSGGVAHVKDNSLENIFRRMGKAVTYGFAKIVTAFISKDGSLGWIFTEIPLLNGESATLVDIGVSFFVQTLLHMDSYPVQLNGAGGEGSYEEGCVMPRIDGYSFWRGDMEFTNGRGEKETLVCPPGGEGGSFGWQGELLTVERSWLSTANQEMPVFYRKDFPEDLVEALTFSVKFDTTGVDDEKDYPEDFDVVFSDSIPRHIVVPTSREGSQFLGYCDNTGSFWYTDKGEAISNSTDSAGNPLYLFLNPGDLTLTPVWRKYAYVVINHWVEGTGLHPVTNAEDYSIKSSELKRGNEGALYLATAKSLLPYFIAVKSSDTLTLKAGKDNVINFYYNRIQNNLAWDVPSSMSIVDAPGTYTSQGKIRYGARIKAPRYAKDNTSGMYYELSNWRESDDTTKVLTDTMPGHPTAYAPTCTPIPARFTIYNNDLQGEVQTTTQWLGTNVSITVNPVEGLELDTCLLYAITADSLHQEAIYQTSGNTLTWYASPNVDSMIVVVRYRGLKHVMNYSEEESSFRRGTMTWFVNGDSIGNDGGINGKHDVRTGDYVWIRPEEAANRNVCKSLKVTTASGKTIHAEFSEGYDAFNRYDMHYTFIMPNEDVRVEASYGTLSDELVTLRMLCDTGNVKVYSKRGQLLNNQYVFGQGYKVDAGQIVWIEIENMLDLPAVDSIRVRYYKTDGSYEYSTIQRTMFVKTMQDITQPVDTAIPPKVFPRYFFRIPRATQEVLVEFHHDNCKLAWENEHPEAGWMDRTADPNSREIYDLMGRYRGTSIQHLPAGVYVRGGKKLIIH